MISRHISVSRSSRKCYQSCMKSTELSGIFYEEIVMYYNKSLSKMFKNLNDMITDQLVIGRDRKSHQKRNSKISRKTHKHTHARYLIVIF
jgi:hypothetical protein